MRAHEKSEGRGTLKFVRGKKQACDASTSAACNVGSCVVQFAVSDASGIPSD